MGSPSISDCSSVPADHFFWLYGGQAGPSLLHVPLAPTFASSRTRPASRHSGDLARAFRVNDIFSPHISLEAAGSLRRRESFPYFLFGKALRRSLPARGRFRTFRWREICMEAILLWCCLDFHRRSQAFRNKDHGSRG